MSQEQPNNPIHGVKLDEMLYYLVSHYGWEELGNRIRINCFNNNPTIKSSLSFLRRTPWAKEKVQRLFIKTIKKES